MGAGALGNEIVKNLALLGVGHLVVIDLDSIERSNLARCVLFRDSDAGQPKAPLLAQRAAELNAEVRAVGIQGDVRHDLGLGAFMDADIVLGGLDNREARLFLNGACWKTTTPWVDGAIEGLMGVMRVFQPPNSPCYESTLSSEDHEMMAQRRACSLIARDELDSGKIPTTATSASVIAGMQVQEAIKLLHADRLELAQALSGQGVVFNGMTHDTYVVSYAIREDALTRDTYELSDVELIEHEPTFGELLDRSEKVLGPGSYLVLEREIAVDLRCTRCETIEAARCPVTALAAGSGLCDRCGEDRQLDIAHRVTRDDPLTLRLKPSDLGLPEADIVTATDGSARHFFLIQPRESPFRTNG